MELFGTILIGIPLLFVAFVILWGIEIIIVKLIRKLTGKEPKMPAKKAAAASAPATPVQIEELPVEGAYGGEIKLYNVDEITAAMVMAIVSDNTGIPLNRLVFKSIKAIKEF